VEAVLELAAYSIRCGQAERDLTLLDGLPSAASTSARGWLLRARALEDMGRVDVAREAWSAARDADAESVWGIVAAAALDRDSGQTDARDWAAAPRLATRP
jgi:hypothetical protein